MEPSTGPARLPDPHDLTPASYTRVLWLSRGGMGQVELAVRKEGRFQRLYAIKRLLPHLGEDEQIKQMFLDEARIAGLIRHANVVPVLDIGEDAAGPFFVMDFVQGISLSQVIRSNVVTPIQVVVRLGIESARGLHAAHELVDHDGHPLGLIHRDVSPQNILVGFDGVVRLTDFGIAKALGQGSRTQTGVLKGKFGYMSPEQLGFLNVDRRADLFALGVVLFELLTGRRLYSSHAEQDGPRRILHEPPPDVGDFRPDIPDSIVELLFSLLSKDPDERPATAEAVADHLERTLAELVTEEGVLGLSSFMGERFAEEKQQSDEDIADALKAAVDRTAREAAVEARIEEETGFTVDVSGLRGRPGTTRLKIAGMIVGLMLVAAAGWYYFDGSSVDPVVTNDPGPVIAPALATPPLAGASAERPREPADSVRAPESAPAAVEPAVLAAPREAEVEPPARPARRRWRPRSRRTTPTPSPDIPVLDTIEGR